MTFARPRLLYGFILFPALFIFWLWTRRRRQETIARLGDPALVDRLSMAVNWRGRRWQTQSWVLALTFLLVALARPQWGSQVQVVEQRGLQVMVALDISQSMLAEDLKPNRLGRAKLEIADLMHRLGGDEIGLVLFSGASFIQFPLTSDYATARNFLDSVRPGAISRPGTALGDAIRTAVSGFDPKQASQKVILLITDGEDHQADTLDAAQKAADQGIVIYAIGFGSPKGEPIPQYDDRGQVTGFKKDKEGQVVLSKLDEVILQRIARIGSGRYYRVRADGSELSDLLSELDQLQRVTRERRFETYGIERFQVFVLIALAAMVLRELIPEHTMSG